MDVVWVYALAAANVCRWHWPGVGVGVGIQVKVVQFLHNVCHLATLNVKSCVE